MEYILVCCWSCIVIFVWMVKYKYYWTVPPLRLCLLFALFGVAATLPALVCNLFLSRETEFWIYSSREFYSFMGFFIGAGLGEEFWKMSAGVVLIIILHSVDYKIKQSDCILGFVSLGLAFAAVENFISYIHLEIHLLITRGLISVPLHATMGMIHGVAVNKSREQNRVGVLLLGYVCAALLHTLCDTWNLFLPQYATRFFMILTTLTLAIWSIKKWQKLPEVDKKTEAVA